MSHRRLEGIKVCVFDAYGTLFDYASAAAQCRGELGAKLDGLNPFRIHRFISLRSTGWASPARRFYFSRPTPGMLMRPRHSACAPFGVTALAKSRNTFPGSLTALSNR